MNLIEEDTTGIWEDWEFQLGEIPAPRDPRTSNHWFIRDMFTLYTEFIALSSTSAHIYNFHLASEYTLEDGSMRRFFVRKRRDKYVDWFEQTYGGPSSFSKVEFLYTEVFNWFLELLDLLDEADTLVEVTHNNNVLEVDRSGDREGGVRKLFEIWEDVRAIVNEYKTRKWHSAFQSTII